MSHLYDATFSYIAGLLAETEHAVMAVCVSPPWSGAPPLLETLVLLTPSVRRDAYAKLALPDMTFAEGVECMLKYPGSYLRAVLRDTSVWHIGPDVRAKRKED